MFRAAHVVMYSRDAEADRALMERHGIEIVVSKNAGGTGAHAKIAAARALLVEIGDLAAELVARVVQGSAQLPQ